MSKKKPQTGGRRVWERGRALGGMRKRRKGREVSLDKRGEDEEKGQNPLGGSNCKNLNRRLR